MPRFQTERTPCSDRLAAGHTARTGSPGRAAVLRRPACVMKSPAYPSVVALLVLVLAGSSLAGEVCYAYRDNIHASLCNNSPCVQHFAASPLSLYSLVGHALSLCVPKPSELAEVCCSFASSRARRRAVERSQATSCLHYRGILTQTGLLAATLPLTCPSTAPMLEVPFPSTSIVCQLHQTSTPVACVLL